MADGYFGLEEIDVISQWLSIIRKLPDAGEAFAERYGDLSDVAALKAFAAAVTTGQHVAAAFGDAAALRANPDRIGKDSPPDGIFEHFVWLAGRISVTADEIAGTIARLRDQSAKADGKTILAGAGSLTQRAAQSRTDIAALRNLLKAQQTAAESVIETLSQTPVYDLAGQEIGKLDFAASQTQQEIGAIDRKSPGWLSNKRRLEEKKAQATARLASVDSARHGWEMLLDDTKPLPKIAGGVASAFIALDAQLAQLWTVFDTLANRANHIVASASPDQLADGAWLYEALGGDNAERQWNGLSASARRFIDAVMANGFSR